MKYSVTNRRHHLRRLNTGRVTGVRKHNMHYWEANKMFEKNRGWKSKDGKFRLNIYDAPEWKGGYEVQIWDINKSKTITRRAKPTLNQSITLAKSLMYKDSDGDGVPDVVDCKPYDPNKQDSPTAYPKDTSKLEGYMKENPIEKIPKRSVEVGSMKKDWFKEFRGKKQLTEAEVNLMLKRINDGRLSKKLDNGQLVAQVEFPDDGYELTSTQVEKGRKWLMNQYKTPAGVERKNNPFGYREQEILDKFSSIRFKDVYSDRGYHYYPYYEVEGNNTSFEYVLIGGKIQILG